MSGLPTGRFLARTNGDTWKSTSPGPFGPGLVSEGVALEKQMQAELQEPRAADGIGNVSSGAVCRR